MWVQVEVVLLRECSEERFGVADDQLLELQQRLLQLSTHILLETGLPELPHPPIILPQIYRKQHCMHSLPEVQQIDPRFGMFLAAIHLEVFSQLLLSRFSGTALAA